MAQVICLGSALAKSMERLQLILAGTGSGPIHGSIKNIFNLNFSMCFSSTDYVYAYVSCFVK